MQGSIKKLTDKNFGFIAQENGGNDLFFHASELVDVDFNKLNVGDMVSFEVVDTPKGKAATQVKLA